LSGGCAGDSQRRGTDEEDASDSQDAKMRTTVRFQPALCMVGGVAEPVQLGNFPYPFHPDLGSVLSGGTGRGYSSRSRSKSRRLDFA
jgi:hypothetical protein